MKCHRCDALKVEVEQWRDARKAWEETARQYAKNAEYYRTTLLALQAHAGAEWWCPVHGSGPGFILSGLLC